MIKRFSFVIILISLVLCLWPPTASSQVFPGAVVSQSDLGVPTNRATTVLTSSINAVTGTIPVGDTSLFSQYAIISIDNETMKCAGKTANSFLGCTRAYDGTSNVIHLNGAVVNGNVVASYFNLRDLELIAIETNLFPGISTTIVVKGSLGANCNLVFTKGLLTSTTCP